MRGFMRQLPRHCLTAAALAACIALTGCATPPPAEPVVAGADQLSPEQLVALGAQAEQAIAAGDLRTGGELYVRIVRAQPDQAGAWFRLGTIYLRTGQPGWAQQAFEQALRNDPQMSKAHANLALAHLRQFRVSAMQAVGSEQISEANRQALKTLLKDVDHVLQPAAATGMAGAPAATTAAPVSTAQAADPGP